MRTETTYAFCMIVQISPVCNYVLNDNRFSRAIRLVQRLGRRLPPTSTFSVRSSHQLSALFALIYTLPFAPRYYTLLMTWRKHHQGAKQNCRNRNLIGRIEGELGGGFNCLPMFKEWIVHVGQFDGSPYFAIIVVYGRNKVKDS